jgi:uncharacterized protein (DUF4415 family)
MPKLKPGTIVPTPEEDAAINAGIAADPDSAEWSDEDFRRAVPFAQLPETVRAKLRAVRGAQKAPTKERITIRLSRDVVDEFRATGAGWQTRMDAALRDWLKTHPRP